MHASITAALGPEAHGSLGWGWGYGGYQIVCTVKIGIRRDMGTLSFPGSLLAVPQLVVQPLLLLGLDPF